MPDSVAVLGSGNVGCAIAGSLALRGLDVRLYSPFEPEIELLRKLGGITLEGEFTGSALPRLMTTDLAQAIDGAELILVAAPGFAHEPISKALSGIVADGQRVVFQPGELGSALALARLLPGGWQGKITLAETATSLYTCRFRAPGTVKITSIKQVVGYGAMPVEATDEVGALLTECFGPHFSPRSDTLEVGLSNTNPVYHCPPTIFNFTSVEQGVDQPLHVLVTPGIARYMDCIDRERLALAEAFGLHLDSFWDYLMHAYDVKGGDFVEKIRQVFGPGAFRAPADLKDRYITEDIPFGLVPWASLASVVGVRTPLIDSLITAANCLVGRDFSLGARSASSLGLRGLSADEIRDAFRGGTVR